MDFIASMQLFECVISPICSIAFTGEGVKSFVTDFMQIEFGENDEFAGFRFLSVREPFAQTITSEAETAIDDVH